MASLYLVLSQAAELHAPGAGNEVIVDHADGLHEGVANRSPARSIDLCNRFSHDGAGAFVFCLVTFSGFRFNRNSDTAL
jgi:hypothetical protein